MKTYREVDVNNIPTVILGCSHFITAETFDSHIGMTEVYTVDAYKGFTGF